MLVSHEGEVIVIGTTGQIIADLSVLLRDVREQLALTEGEEKADFWIKEAGRIAFADDPVKYITSQQEKLFESENVEDFMRGL